MTILPMVSQLIPKPFEVWRDDLCRFFEVHGQPQRFERKDVIFSQGDTPEKVYAIKDGLVDVGSVNEAGREVTYAFRGPRECFGFAEIILGEPRYRSAIALARTDVWQLDAATFVRMVESRTDVILSMLGCTLQRLNRTNEMRVELRGSSAERRIAYSLAQLAQQLAPEQSKQPVSVKLTHEELSRLCDISRQTVTFILDGFREAGILDLGSRAIVVHDTRQLWKIATESSPN